MVSEPDSGGLLDVAIERARGRSDGEQIADPAGEGGKLFRRRQGRADLAAVPDPAERYPSLRAPVAAKVARPLELPEPLGRLLPAIPVAPMVARGLVASPEVHVPPQPALVPRDAHH